MKSAAPNKQLMEALHQHFVTLVNRHKTLDRIDRDFGLEAALTGSEIHIIDVIGVSAISNVTEVAHTLGITKAAASQALGKINRSGYVRKLTDENNKREVLLSLTEKGKQVYQAHRREWEWSCEMFLNDLTERQIEDFNTVAEKIIESINHQVEKNQ